MLTLNHTNLLKTQCLVGLDSEGSDTNELNDGGWVSADSGETIKVTNPFNGENIATVPILSREQVLDAVGVSKKVQRIWANKTADERSALLSKWADLIDAHKEDLARIMTAEQGKPLKESRGEMDYANSYIRWFSAEAKRIYGDTIPAKNSNERIVVLKQPVGVCAAITPWNFPAAMITRKVAPALASGCTMIVKPASETPLTALALGELALQAGIPKGVLQIVTGKSKVLGEVLTGDERIQKLTFTGSTEVGRALMAQCADTIKKLSMELGGNAPFIVFEDADLEAAAEGLIAAKYRNAGQTCICANRIYVHRDIKEKFLDIYVKKVAELKVGNGMEEGTDLGPLINQAAVDKAKDLLQSSMEAGATLNAGGSTHEAGDLCFEPTVITDVTEDMDIANTEIFAPITAIMTFDDETDVIQRANDTIFGLAAYFYTNDLARSWRVCEALEYGMVGQNTGAISNAAAPFGGVKQSGFGREGSKYGIEDYVVTKYWCQNIG